MNAHMAARTTPSIPRMIEYDRQGRFPVDKIMTFYDFKDINQAHDDSLPASVYQRRAVGTNC